MNDYARIEKAIRYIQCSALAQPSLAEMAGAARLTEFHFQRLFSKWTGLSPKKFLQCLTAKSLKERLAESRSVLDATLDCGLSSPGRAHDLLVRVDAVTPGEYKAMGRGLRIEYGFHETPFGKALLGVSARGVCWLSFLSNESPSKALSDLSKAWPGAELVPAQKKTAAVCARAFGDGDVRLFLKGSPFQLKVWEALLRIPEGALISYKDLAQKAGSPGASRAVGSALARNVVAYLIPCHRVIRETGVVGEYRWGTARKHAIIAREASKDIDGRARPTARR